MGDVPNTAVDGRPWHGLAGGFSRLGQRGPGGGPSDAGRRLRPGWAAWRAGRAGNVRVAWSTQTRMDSDALPATRLLPAPAAQRGAGRPARQRSARPGPRLAAGDTVTVLQVGVARRTRKRGEALDPGLGCTPLPTDRNKSRAGPDARGRPAVHAGDRAGEQRRAEASRGEQRRAEAVDRLRPVPQPRRAARGSGASSAAARRPFIHGPGPCGRLPAGSDACPASASSRPARRVAHFVRFGAGGRDAPPGVSAIDSAAAADSAARSDYAAAAALAGAAARTSKPAL